MKILVIGSKGQLGHELVNHCKNSGIKVSGFDLPEIDISSRDQVEKIISDTAPSLVINAAAYTLVDKAESDEITAYAVNKTGPGNIAESCRKTGIPLIHISTDFVFDGKKNNPYLESDKVSPLSVYGKSKAAGDDAVRDILNQHIIIRTSWLYGVYGNNFVKTMIRLGKERDELNVVADQYGCPTCAADLARAVLSTAAHIHDKKETIWGTYHYCGKGITSWHGFTEAILEYAGQHIPLKTKKVNAITTAEYPTPAKRPSYSALDCTRIQENFGISQESWKESLKKTIDKIISADKG
ncbi:dTDP-4-dehydrorhamnose reductase [Desulfonema limicola]|uniref:dTDP-4-dehydrorhamnose reductase n=1 Tax=Desulfonema limicola TaxID=45656 RepID=A0A975BDA8_9BACT|nr:dTDP-4-dehydrorhamnose reductase [Desulfonema limicola]QTA83064.1 dTDP-4-dehydrorhamnose reductase [Desulfonema limicola]